MNGDLVWCKASASGVGNCVEVAAMEGGGVAVRDSKDLSGLVLCFGRGEWEAFLAGVRAGEFDLKESE